MERIEFNEGRKFIEENLKKLKRILEGSPENVNSAEYMEQYTKVYNMCMHDDYNEQLSNKYKEFIVGYIKSAVIPSPRDKSDEIILLREFAKRW